MRRSLFLSGSGWRTALLLGALVSALPSGVRAQDVHLQNIDVTAGVTQGGTSTSQQSQLTNPSFPFSRTQSPSTGGVSNQTVYLFDSTSAQTSLSLDFAHGRSNLGLSESYGTILFATSVPLFYSLSGDWSLAGTASYFNQQALLETTDRAVTIFDGRNVFTGFFQPQASNLNYDLGVLQGDPFFSHRIGSNTGILPAGDYVFEYSYDFENISAPSSSAGGSLTLTLAQIPETESRALMSVGLGLLAVVRLMRSGRAGKPIRY